MTTLFTRRKVLPTIAAGAAAGTLGFAQGEGRQVVGMQLILAADTSLSVLESRYDMQMDGYLEAFQSGRLFGAIQNLEPPSLAVLFVLWGSYPQILIPWSVLSGKASLLEFCGRFAAQSASRPRAGAYTRIDYLMKFCRTQFDLEFVSQRRVLDVSGDGGNSYAPISHKGLRQEKELLIAQGVTINGLPILVVPPDTISPEQPSEGLDVYYRNHVVGGPGAFVIPSQGFEGFRNAILAKLVAEVA